MFVSTKLGKLILGLPLRWKNLPPLRQLTVEKLTGIVYYYVSILWCSLCSVVGWVGVADSHSCDASQRRRRVGDNNKIETASPNCHNSHNTNYLSNKTTFKHIKEQRGHQGDKSEL